MGLLSLTRQARFLLGVQLLWSRRWIAAAALRTRLRGFDSFRDCQFASAGAGSCSRPRIGRLPCEGGSSWFDSTRERCGCRPLVGHQFHTLVCAGSIPAPAMPMFQGDGALHKRSPRAVRVRPSVPLRGRSMAGPGSLKPMTRVRSSHPELAARPREARRLVTAAGLHPAEQSSILWPRTTLARRVPVNDGSL